MSHTNLLTKKSSIRQSGYERAKIVRLSLQLLDLAEDVLDEMGGYKTQFLQGLHTSIQQAKNGKKQKITSLAELK